MYAHVSKIAGATIVLAFAGSATLACGATDGEGLEEAPLIKDIASMVRQPDGSFRVTCANGSVERRSADDLAAQRVCNGGGAGGSCVEGNASFCTDPSEHWTGTLCCVDGAPTCADGNASFCTDPKEHWTGAKCCVENAPTCAAGDASFCTDPKEHWTGAECCVDDGPLCVEGSAPFCTDPAEHWTGALCCVESVSTCVDGSASFCTGPRQHWTGEKCCIDG